MKETQQAKEKNSSRFRLRLSVGPSLLSFDHLQGKTEKESRAWALMALEYFAALQNMTDQAEDGRPNIELPTSSRKRSHTNSAATPQRTGEAKVGLAGREAPASKKDPGGGNYLAKEIEGW